MEKFTVHRGIAAPLLRINVDTDAIIPSREMKFVSKTGLGQGLFAGWRYLSAAGREPNPDFVLNQPAYAGASVLLSGANFGCGSSREHAVWALKEFGIRALIAPSFGGIFRANCIRNGLLPVTLPEPAIDALHRAVAPDPQQNKVTIDLVAQKVMSPDGAEYGFAIDPLERQMLLEGLDPIALTAKLEDEINAFQARDRVDRPWIYLGGSG